MECSPYGQLVHGCGLIRPVWEFVFINGVIFLKLFDDFGILVCEENRSSELVDNLSVTLEYSHEVVRARGEVWRVWRGGDREPA